MKKTLVFDYDGTIHDTYQIYEQAFYQCEDTFIKAGYIENKSTSKECVRSFIGMNAKEMWKIYQPSLSEELREKGSGLIGKYMEEAVLNHKAKWYAGAEETLTKLKQDGYSMVILSNSKKRGAMIHWQTFQMDKWFDKWYDCESYHWAPKTEIIKEIRDSYGSDLVVIGDRKADLDAAKSIKVPFVGCLYGYGTKEELKAANWFISDMKQLAGSMLF